MEQAISLCSWGEIHRPAKLMQSTEYCTVSEADPITSGVKQGCLLSPALWQWPIASCGDKEAWLRILALLMFADDIALMAETKEDFLHVLNTLYSLCEC